MIGVNSSYKLGDWVDVCWFGDHKWWKWEHKNLRKYFKGEVAHCCAHTPIEQVDWVHFYKRSNQIGIETKPNWVRWNHCSGLSAINFAYHTGASRVVLLGFDMKVNGEEKNWYVYEEERELMRWTYKAVANKTCDFDTWYLRHFGDRYKYYKSTCGIIQHNAKKLGMEIINAGPDSAITQFPKIPLMEVLENAM